MARQKWQTKLTKAEMKSMDIIQMSVRKFGEIHELKSIDEVRFSYVYVSEGFRSGEYFPLYINSYFLNDGEINTVLSVILNPKEGGKLSVHEFHYKSVNKNNHFDRTISKITRELVKLTGDNKFINNGVTTNN